MNAHPITRVSARELSAQRFLADYVRQNQPVVVTGALESWWRESDWAPGALGQRFGDELAQVYNNYFDILTTMPLKRYLSRYFSGSGSGKDAIVPYIRWYTKLHDGQLCWADDIFSRLSNQWCAPSFVPSRDYLLPYTASQVITNPLTDRFPAKGLFISPRGARTSLHVDPWGSCAILCQLYGYKRWYLYAPDQAAYLGNSFGVVDVTRPDMKKFPEFPRATLTLDCVLAPGEAIYVPNGWFHQVECDSDAVSVTWNFVHCARASAMIEWLQNGRLSGVDQSILGFFYDLPRGADAAAEVLTRIQNRLIDFDRDSLSG